MSEMKDLRWKLRFENYERAYLSLLESQKALEEDKKNSFIQDSLIQRYEYTIELAWKTMKDYLEEQGFIDVSSPKSTVRKAFQEGMVQDGSAWINALDDRNRTSHAYEEKIADEVTEAICERHIPIFRDLFFYLKGEMDV